MRHTWHYSNNQFETVTRGSFIKAVIISSFLDSALYAGSSTSAAILTLYNYYHPIHLNLKEAYEAWVAKGGQQIGDSLALVQVFNQMTVTVNRWDAAIGVVYDKGTPQYVALLPHGHGPFIHGKQEDRITAIAALSTNLTSITALATLKTQVDDVYALITGINTTQKGDVSNVGVDSTLLEGVRKEICVSMYYVLGGLIQEFAHTPDRISDFYDLETIQQIKQMIYTGTIHSSAPHKILKRTFTAGDEINVLNDGDTEYKIYLSHLKEGAIGTTFITVPAGTDANYPVSDLGDIANTFLTVQCDAGSGHYEVELL